MENCFIILELPFDPPETDMGKIEQAIQKKQQIWQQWTNNPKHRLIAQEYLNEIPVIQDIMLDSQKRTAEAQKALTEKNQIKKNIKNELEILAVKGFISEKDIHLICNKYKCFQITEKDIQTLSKVPIHKIESTSKWEMPVFDSKFKNLIMQIENYMHNLKKKNISLYFLYGLPEYSDLQKVQDAAQNRIKEILENGQSTNRNDIEQKIAGLAKNIFNNNQQKKCYDYYISGHRYSDLNTLIDEGIHSNKTFDKKLYQTLYKIADSTYHMKDSEIQTYFQNYMGYEGIPYEDTVFQQPIILQPSSAQQSKQPLEQENEKTLSAPKPKDKTLLQSNKGKESKSQNALTMATDNVRHYFKSVISQTKKLSKQIKSYQENRLESGAAPNVPLTIAAFISAGISSLGLLILYISCIIEKNNNAQGVLTILNIGIIAILISTGILFFPYLKWKKLIKNNKLVCEKNEIILKTIHNSFIPLTKQQKSLNENAYIAQLNKIQNKIELNYKSCINTFNRYIDISNHFNYISDLRKNAVGILVPILFLLLGFVVKNFGITIFQNPLLT